MCLNTFGQNTHRGKIVGKETPTFSLEFPPIPCLILWLETTSDNYILSINSHWICDNKIIVNEIAYEIDNEVEITGTIISSGIDIYLVEHFTLEIETISKLISIETQSLANNKVYYNTKQQAIIIDANLLKQNLTLELYNTQGQIILKTSINNNSVSLSNLQSGMYLYRLLQNDKEVYSGKILK